MLRPDVLRIIHLVLADQSTLRLVVDRSIAEACQGALEAHS